MNVAITAMQSGPARRQLNLMLVELCVKLAKAGQVVTLQPDHAFTCAQYGLSRYCESYDGLVRFAVRLGVCK